MLKNFLNAILLILLLPIVCAAEEVDVKKLTKADWINIESANFNVLTNASEKDAVEIVQELENFKYFLSLSLGFEQKNLSEKVPVIAAKNKSSFLALGIPDSYAGLFVRGNGYSIFVRCDGFQGGSGSGANWGRSVVLHELVHLFIHNSSVNLTLPPWYEEGMAEYFGTYVESKKDVTIGRMDILRARFYNMFDIGGKVENVDTESLFKTSKAEIDVVDTSRKHKEYLNKFYARAVAAIHYMRADADRMKQLNQYLFFLRLGRTVDEAFNIAFKETYSDLDKEIHGYFSKNLLTAYSYRKGKGGMEFPVVEYKKNSIPNKEAFEILYPNISRLPGAYLGEGNFGKFNSEVEKVYPGLVENCIRQDIIKYPTSIVPLTRLAVFYGEMNRYKDAIETCDKVLQLNGSNSFILNNFAWLLATCPDDKYRDGTKAVALAEKAIEINPQSEMIYDTAAAAYAETGDFKKAIAMQEKAIELLTSKEKENKGLDILKKHLNSYKNNLPLRETPSSITASK
jgi:tetratricopeptide (TPR) repeat protein